MQQQHGQHRARLDAPQPHRTALAAHFKRPEYLKVHQSLSARYRALKRLPRVVQASAPTATPGAPGMISGHTGSRSLSCLAIWRAITSRWISFAPS